MGCQSCGLWRGVLSGGKYLGRLSSLPSLRSILLVRSLPARGVVFRDALGWGNGDVKPGFGQRMVLLLVGAVLRFHSGPGPVIVKYSLQGCRGRRYNDEKADLRKSVSSLHIYQAAFNSIKLLVLAQSTIKRDSWCTSITQHSANSKVETYQ